MKKIDQYKELLIEQEGKELTTKYMIENLGITSYYIGSLTHQGILEKVSRGIYKVLSPNKTKEEKNLPNDKRNDARTAKKTFDTFRDYVLNENYLAAYSALISCVEGQKGNHDYDNHYRMYFILLTHILKRKGMKIPTYNYDEKLMDFYGQSSSEFFFSYVSFNEAVLSHNFEEANLYLQEYATKEAERYKENKISTTLFKKLLETIDIIEKNKKITSVKLSEIYELVRKKKYEQASILMQEIKPLFNTLKFQNMMDYLSNLCKTLIAFQNDESLILPKKKQYDFKGNETTSKVFDIFMQNEDYGSAIEYVEKCYELYRNVCYAIARNLLKELIFLNRIHTAKKISISEIQKMRNSTSKDQGAANRYFSHFLGDLHKLDFESAFNNIKKSLSYEENKDSLAYRRGYNQYILLKQLIDMQQSGLPMEENHVVYLSHDSDVYNLNRAIKQRDWQSAQKYLYKVGINSSLNLEAYDLLLKAIFRQDKINRGIALTEEDELKPLTSHLQKDLNNSSKETPSKPEAIVSPKEKTEEKIETPSETVVEEVKEKDSKSATKEIEETTENVPDPKEILSSIEGLDLNYDNLSKLIQNRNFEAAYALLSQGKQTIEEKKEEDTPEEAVTKSDEKEAPTTATEETPQEKEPQPEPVLSEKEKHHLEVLESIKDLDLNYDNLYDLVYNSEYEKALCLLEREEETSRLYFNARRLITQYFHIVNGTFKEVEQTPIDYSQDCFKLFFAALNNRDYQFALELTNECIECTNDPKEMQLFKLILEDIVKELDKKQAIKEGKIKIEEINKELQALSLKHEFADSDVRTCYKLLRQKMEIAEECKLRFDKDLLVFGASEAAMMALNKALNNYYFADASNTEVADEFVSASINLTSQRPEEIFFESLKYGDYLTAEKFLSNTNWDVLREKMTGSNLRLLKNLFLYMHEHMSIVSEQENVPSTSVSQEQIEKAEKNAYDLLDEEGKKAYHQIEFLEKLHSLVKHQKYTDALGMLFDTDIPLAEDKGLIDILAGILLAKEWVKEESHSLFDKFAMAERKHDIDQAYSNLREYSSYLSSKSIDRDITYHYKRLRILEKDLKQPNFEEKEAIYSQAVETFFNRKEYNNLKKAIELLNQYIAMDNDLNYKGYALRARAYELLKEDELAKADYQKALSISDDPRCLYSLGRYAFAEGDYEKSVRYLESYQAIRPFKSENVSQMLATCYNSIGEKEKALPYDKHLKHMSYLKK